MNCEVKELRADIETGKIHAPNPLERTADVPSILRFWRRSQNNDNHYYDRYRQHGNHREWPDLSRASLLLVFNTMILTTSTVTLIFALHATELFSAYKSKTLEGEQRAWPENQGRFEPAQLLLGSFIMIVFSFLSLDSLRRPPGTYFTFCSVLLTTCLIWFWSMWNSDPFEATPSSTEDVDGVTFMSWTCQMHDRVGSASIPFHAMCQDMLWARLISKIAHAIAWIFTIVVARLSCELYINEAYPQKNAGKTM